MMIFDKIFRGRSLTLSALMVFSFVVLSGCSMGDVQFEGKIFEAAGLTNINVRDKDPKVAERAPLVLPPQKALPVPGKRIAAKDEMNWPDDPDMIAKRQKSLAEQERLKYCNDVGRDENNIYYDEKKARNCHTFFSNTANKAFGRAAPDEKQ